MPADNPRSSAEVARASRPWIRKGASQPGEFQSHGQDARATSAPRRRGASIRVLLALAAAALLGTAPSHADSAGAWTRLPDLPTARLAAGAVAFDGKLYVIGGCVVRDGAVHPIAAVEVFLPDTGTWETRAPLPTPRSNFGIAIANGLIFVIGGTPTDSTSQTDVVEAYDPVTDTWNVRAPLPTPRSQVGAAVVDGKIYAIGGNRRHEHAFDVYDPPADRWSTLRALPRPRRDASVAVLDGKIYVSGGLGYDGRYPIDALQAFDPAADRWSDLTPPRLARCDSAVVTLNGALVALGGYHRGPNASVEAYHPASDTWSEREPLPIPTQFHCAAVLDGRIYMAGGTNKLPSATTAMYVWEPALALGAQTSSSAVRKRSETHPSGAASSHADEPVAPSDTPLGSREAFAKTETLTRSATKLTQPLSEIARTSELPGFAVAVVTANGAAYERGFGWADLEKRVPYTATTIQPIASVSKTVIGVCLMHAVEHGTVSLDTPVASLVPFPVAHPRFPGTAITLRHLATHTSGIVDRSVAYRAAYTPGRAPAQGLGDYLVSYFAPGGKWFSAQNFAPSRPGEAYAYSNLGAALAAFALEQSAGRSFADLSREIVFAPLGMNDTTWAFDAQKAARHARLYDRQQEPVSPYALVTYPDGGLHTSCHDLALYLAEMIRGHQGRGRLLSTSSYAALFAPQFATNALPPGVHSKEPNTGLFWAIRDSGNIGHTGGDPGVGAFLFFKPSSGTGALFMTNRQIEGEAARRQIPAIVDALKAFGAALVATEPH